MSHPVIGPAGGRRPSTGVLVAIVGVLVAIVVGIFVFSGAETPADKPVQVTVPPVTGGNTVTPPVTNAPDAVPETPVARAPRAGDEARALIAELRGAGGMIDLHQVHVRAVHFADENKPVDAYLLWFFAAREGHGPSAFVLGELYDPEYYNAARYGAVIGEADPAQALKWYQRALNAGEAMADERIAALTQRVERAAASGDEDARRLMLSW